MIVLYNGIEKNIDDIIEIIKKEDDIFLYTPTIEKIKYISKLFKKHNIKFTYFGDNPTVIKVFKF